MKRVATGIAAAVIIVAIGACAFFIYTLTLRTDYKNTALAINDAILENSTRMSIQYEDKEVPVSLQDMDYYNAFLLDKNTVVYSRKNSDPTAKAITLRIDAQTLTLDKLEDDTAILVTWETAQEKKCFRVRSMTTFIQLDAKRQNIFRAAEKA